MSKTGQVVVQKRHPPKHASNRLLKLCSCCASDASHHHHRELSGTKAHPLTPPHSSRRHFSYNGYINQAAHHFPPTIAEDPGTSPPTTTTTDFSKRHRHHRRRIVSNSTSSSKSDRGTSTSPLPEKRSTDDDSERSEYPKPSWEIPIDAPKVYDFAIIPKTNYLVVPELDLTFYSINDHCIAKTVELTDDNGLPLIPLCVDANRECLYVTAANRLFGSICVLSHNGDILHQVMVPYIRRIPRTYGISILESKQILVTNPRNRSIDIYSQNLLRRKRFIDTTSVGRPYSIAQHSNWPDRLVVTFPEQHKIGIYDISRYSESTSSKPSHDEIKNRKERKRDYNPPLLTAYGNPTLEESFKPSSVRVCEDGRILIVDKHTGTIFVCDQQLKILTSCHSGVNHTVSILMFDTKFGQGLATLEGQLKVAKISLWNT